MAPRSIGGLQERLATLLLRRLEPAGVGLELWDGRVRYSGTTPSIGTLVVRDARTLLGLLIDSDLHFGETYTAGTLEVRGNFEDVLDALSRTAVLPTWQDRARQHLRAFGNSLGRSRRNVHHHYDLGNDFYRLWLDEQLVYTCAYFEDRDDTLEQAQIAKLDLVCRKLRLQPGETVVEAGCGWGALALHMVRTYGVTVKAFNISREQIAYARARAAHEGLASKVEFIDDDYRNVKGGCDVFVSVGMLEHVGPKHFQSLAGVIARILTRGTCRGLLHFIGRDIPRPLNAWIRRRIFPGAYVPTLGEAAREVLEPARMSILDIENLRLHYALTLGHWYRRFCLASDQVRARYGDEFTRAWKLYLAGSEAAFLSGTLQLFQVVFAPVGATPPYWTRDALYRRAEVPSPVGVGVRGRK